MNLNSLRIFAAVARHQGFTAAARAIHVSQPAVSKAVRDLERRAGMPLVERGGRGLRLTEAGAVLYDHARRIFALELAAEGELRARRGVEAGTLRVGASTTIATYLLPRLLSSFAHAHPAVELKVASLNTRDVARRLAAYELDVALVEGPVREEAIDALPWRDDELVVVAPAGHALLTRGDVDVHDLAAERMLVREPGSGTREVAEAALRGHGVELPRTVEMGSTEAIKRSVAAGLGLAILSRATLDDALAAGALGIVAVRGLRIPRALHELVVRSRPESPAAAAFRALLRRPDG